MYDILVPTFGTLIATIVASALLAIMNNNAMASQTAKFAGHRAPFSFPLIDIMPFTSFIIPASQLLIGRSWKMVYRIACID
jgi:hypothetical protein